MQDTDAETAVCCRFAGPSLSYFMLHSSCYKFIDLKRQGTPWMWLAVWMWLGRDRSHSGCVLWRAQRVSPLTSVPRAQTPTSLHWISVQSCHGSSLLDSKGGWGSIFRDVVSAGGKGYSGLPPHGFYWPVPLVFRPSWRQRQEINKGRSISVN